MNLAKPHYAYRLRQFDESNPSKITSQAVTPRSVVGIGGKGSHLTPLVNAGRVYDLGCSGEAGLL